MTFYKRVAYANIAFLIICACTMSSAQAAILTHVPTSHASNEKQFWRDIMREFYGPYSKADKCWIASHEGKSYCMRPGALSKVAGKDGAASYFVAVMGKPLGDASCHACTGNVGLFVLRPSGTYLGLQAQSDRYVELGAWGEPPADDSYAVRLFGADDNYGWVISTGYTAQGETSEGATLYGVIGDQVKEVGYLPLSFDDNGNCENHVNTGTNLPCSDYKFEPVFDSDSSSSKFAPIVLRASGTKQGKTFDQTFTILFDEKSAYYKLPPELAADQGQ